VLLCGLVGLSTATKKFFGGAQNNTMGRLAQSESLR